MKNLKLFKGNHGVTEAQGGGEWVYMLLPE